MFHRRIDGQSGQNSVHTWPTPVQVKKDSPGVVSRGLAGFGVGVLAIAASPFIAIAKGGHYLKDQYRIKFKPNSILTCTIKMKATEEAAKLDTMQRVREKSEDLIIEVGGSGNLGNVIGAKIDSVKINMAKRIILKHLSRQGASANLLNKVKDDSNFVKVDGGKVQINLDGDMKSALGNESDFQSVIDEVEERTKVLSDKGEIAKYEASIKELYKILDNINNQKSEDVNKKFLKALRVALNSPIYQALKEDTSDPSVKLLHRFASALWNQAPSMDAFLLVGKTINTKLLNQKPVAEEGEASTRSKGSALADKLRVSRKRVAKEYWTNHGLFNKAMYAITHPRHTMGSMASTGGMLRAMPGSQTYDSHEMLSNNPSLQGVSTHTFKAGDNQYSAKVNNCYGGSPTINDDISPEFLAVLQAAENNQLAVEPDPDIPQMVNYTNLQDLNKKHGEGPRSKAIMALNDQFPLSFFGMTLSKDSDFYRMKSDTDVVYRNAGQFGAVMKGHLMRGFEPDKTGHGYHFPGEPKAWEEKFDKILAKATQHFGKISISEDPRKLQGAYQEYVYSMLNAMIELESIKALRERGIKTPKIMTIKACKENIDRGGMENIKYMYTKLSQTKLTDEDKDDLLLGCMHGRPLSARDRVILEDRMPQVLSFMELIEPENFHSQMIELLQDLGYEIDGSSFAPAYTEVVEK